MSSCPLPRGIPGGNTFDKSTLLGLGMPKLISAGDIRGGNAGGKNRLEPPTRFLSTPVIPALLAMAGTVAFRFVSPINGIVDGI